MKAAVLWAPGERLRVEEVPQPVPGPGEVLVRVAACGVCHSDLHVMKGEVAFPTPAVLGHEISGTVATLGPGVEGPAPGTRVSCSFILPCGRCPACARGRDDLCERFYRLNRLRGLSHDGTTRLRTADGRPLAAYSMGGLAEYAVVPVEDVFPLPGGLPLEESAVLGCAAFTAYGALRHGADLRAGEQVAVVAVGGVGGAMVQLARAFGARRVIAVDVAEDKLEMARALGATDLVHAGREDPVARVRALTDGEGVDAALEALGRPQTFVWAVDMLRDGGRMVAVGLAAAEATASLPITRLVRRGLRVVGSYGARTRADMPVVLGLAAAGAIRPERMVTRRFPLADAAEAYALLDRGAVRGRAVVVPGAA
jgi:succinate semialdehyde reductase (NADPH)